MKSIHRVPITPDINYLVEITVPDGELTGLHFEGTSGAYFVHLIGEDGAETQQQQFLFAQAAVGSVPSALLDITDLTNATYLGYANGLHAWML